MKTVQDVYGTSRPGRVKNIVFMVLGAGLAIFIVLAFLGVFAG